MSLAIGHEMERLEMIRQLGRTMGGSNIRSLGCILIILCGSITGSEATGQEPSPAITLDQLLGMAPGQLESVYRQGIAAVPRGGSEARRSWRQEPGENAYCRAVHGFCGKERCSSTVNPPPSIVSSGFG